MISDTLLASLACPLCLVPEGCAECGAQAHGHADCERRYAERSGCACGGPDKVALVTSAEGLQCPCCGAVYALSGGAVDLVPRTALGDGTRYAEHEFQERLDVADNPLLLSARVKANRMRTMLGLRPGDRVLDLGCGAGRFALFTAGHGAQVVGLDIAPFFLPRAERTVDLVLGDLRRLPFRKGVFPRAYSLDVLEHLDEPGVRDVLVEARRVLADDGRLFVYTHATESSWLARFQRAVNRLAWGLGRWGLIDAERERMRKSDHRNAIRSHEHFEALCAGAGLVVDQRRYYNVVFKAIVEDLALRLYEQAWRGRQRIGRSNPPASGTAVEPVRGTSSGQRPRYGRRAVFLGRALSALLELDVLLFSRIRTGPFFATLRPHRTRGAATGSPA